MQAITVEQIPAPPGTPRTAAPGIAPVPGVSIVAGVPTTAAEVQALRAKRSELSNQLESAASRRARLSSSLTGKEGADRAGIEARIGVLDKRMLQLESDIAETGRQLTMTPSALVASTEAASQIYGMNPDSVAALGGVFTLFVLAPVAFSAARMMWKRATAPAPPPAISVEASRRLERLEQGMDAIAVEIERVSEGQRFVTRLLSESHGSPAIMAPQRTPDGVLAGSSAEDAQRARA